MKLTITGLAAFAASKTYADVCNQACGSHCDENDAELANWNQAGFESSADCEAHACSSAFPEGGADWHTCERGARELEERKYNHIVKMTYKIIKNKGNGTNLSLRQIFKQIQNYGCHCFPGQTRDAGGHGPAVDAQDELCRDLSRCHRCISMEHGDVIDVNDDKYRWHFKDGDLTCERNTAKGWHQSKRDLCECDAQFARDLGMMWDDNSFNNFYWMLPSEMKKPFSKRHPDHQNKFDIDATCVQNLSGKADACCGSYPNILPYDTQEKSCCQNTNLYNSLLSQCCNDGTVAGIGDC